ncbi:hypothetical protein P6F26_11505 [Roseibacterium sp. SDUM158017]|uniref:hypothetical protein n=1 Tax=Roseicyclus salinarum TaxID=3036773 RepID=UPI00241575A1|nr:hypothetical protein [Roseibacterium sp. SDUM158017]MDG4649072.1 hypothetical protein [Roseibacterium sp. SDUM158017]
MTIIETDGPLASDMARFRGHTGALAGEVRVGDEGFSCRITRVSAGGVELELDPPLAERALAKGLSADATIHIPCLGVYRARRLWRSGMRAAYLFELTEFSRRALDALIRDRFPG